MNQATAARGGEPDQSVSRFFVRGGAAALLARLLAVVAGLGVQMLLARLLEPAVFGAYFLTQSVVAFVALVGQLGLPRMLVREIARAMGSDRPERARGTLRTAVGIACVGVGSVALLYGGVLGRGVSAIFGAPLLAGTAWLAALWVVSLSGQNLAAESLRGLRRVGAATLLGGALTSAMTAAVLLLLFVTRGESTLGEVVVVSVATSSVSFLLATRLVSGRMRGVRAERVAAGVLLGGTTAMLIASIGQTGAAQADLWLVGAHLSESDVAVYGAAKRLMRLVSLPMVVVTLVVPPVIADLYHRGEHERLQRIIRGVSALAALPAVVVLGGFAFLGADVLGLFYGDFYRSGAPILAILSFERLLFVWGGPCGMTLLMTGHERRLMAVTLIAGAVEVVAVWVGVARGGAVGAAVGFLVGSGLRNLATWDQARRVAGIRTDVGPMQLRDSLDSVRAALRRRGAGG